MDKKKVIAWLKAAGIRAVKTVAQTMLGVITGSAVLYEVDWRLVFGAAAVAGVTSLLTSLAGLPELPDSDGDGIPDVAE